MNTCVKHLLTWGFVSYGIWFLYLAFISFTARMPITSCLTVVTAMMGFAAAYFSWNEKWRFVLLFFLLLLIVGDVAAVFFASQR